MKGTPRPKRALECGGGPSALSTLTSIWPRTAMDAPARPLGTAVRRALTQLAPDRPKFVTRPCVRGNTDAAIPTVDPRSGAASSDSLHAGEERTATVAANGASRTPALLASLASTASADLLAEFGPVLAFVPETVRRQAAELAGREKSVIDALLSQLRRPGEAMAQLSVGANTLNVFSVCHAPLEATAGGVLAAAKAGQATEKSPRRSIAALPATR